MGLISSVPDFDGDRLVARASDAVTDLHAGIGLVTSAADLLCLLIDLTMLQNRIAELAEEANRLYLTALEDERWVS